jgi:hypothetical protein
MTLRPPRPAAAVCLVLLKVSDEEPFWRVQRLSRVMSWTLAAGHSQALQDAP